MKFPTPRITAGRLWAAGLIVLCLVAVLTRDAWWGKTQGWIRASIARNRTSSQLHEHGDEHADHEHPPGTHNESNSLELSAQALGNIGLTKDFLRPIQLQTFRRTMTVPGIIVERPGRTRVEVSTPMSGVVTHVHAVQGEAVKPGTLLFQLRITAEALVSTQTDLLKTVGELDVENREITRLTKVTESGAIAQKTLLERQYSKDKLEALLAAQKEALRLLGLSDRQIDDIATQRRLLRELQIVAPSADEHSADELKLTADGPFRQASYKVQHDANDDDAPLILREVRVHKGQTVAAGEMLAALGDYSELYIEGQSFQQDLAAVRRAAQHGWGITAVIEESEEKSTTIPDLSLVYSGSEVRADSRSLPFYVRLPNEIAHSSTSSDGQHFLDWKYRLGDRVQLQVPVEEWADQIVLPVDALARDGADYFVFVLNGAHFERTPVHVIYKDQTSAVVANDGSIVVGNIAALTGAHQMLMALKNKSGAGVDPHAGHNH